jgi:hypothetical protein
MFCQVKSNEPLFSGPHDWLFIVFSIFISFTLFDYISWLFVQKYWLVLAVSFHVTST